MSIAERVGSSELPPAPAAGRRAAVARRGVAPSLLHAGAAGATVLVSFALWGLAEEWMAPGVDARFRMHYARGISTSLAASAVVGLLALRQHRARARELEGEVDRRGRDAESAKALLQVVVDKTPAALVVLDRDRNVVHANRMAEQVHGASIEGQHCVEALAGCGSDCRECAGHGAALLESPAPARQYTDPRTGEVLDVERHFLALPDGSEYTLLVERVITEQKKLQAHLLHQEKMAAFGLLAAGIAHDLGNPLSSVEAQLQVLDTASLPPRAAAIIGTVREEAARLRRILRELIDLARRRRTEAALVSVQAVVQDALRLLRHDPRMRRVEVLAEFDAESPPVLMVEDHLMQVVLNLLINALDAMPDGGNLRVEVGPRAPGVVLRLQDSGIGMDAAVLTRCFEPLFTTKAPGRGTGLGLSIVRDILAAVGGSIALESTAGQGTSVQVTLPAAVATVPASREVRAAPAAP